MAAEIRSDVGEQAGTHQHSERFDSLLSNPSVWFCPLLTSREHLGRRVEGRHTHD